MFSWLIKNFAKILLDEIKHEYTKDIERIKKEYQKEVKEYESFLTLFREDYLRYYGEQFKLYINIWKILCELKKAGDVLWDEANHKNLKKFAELLEKASDELEKGSLFIENEHYIQMLELIDTFNGYNFGKFKLIEIYNKNNFEREVAIYDIEKLIRNNNNYKYKYQELLEDVRDSIKEQLKRKIT